MVTDVPEYAPPPVETNFDELSEIDLPYNAWVPPKSERQIMEERHRAQKLQEWKDQRAAIRANLERASITPRQEMGHVATAASAVQAKAQPSAPAPERIRTEPVGTAARGCPGREATMPATTTPTPVPQNSNSAAPKPAAIAPHHFPKTPQPTAPATSAHAATRKPPQSTTPAPKERKDKAHSLP